MRNADEMPERRFAIRSFAVGRYEITRDQYAAFSRATNREPQGNCLTDRHRAGDWQLDAATTFIDPGFTQSGDEPVACVSWDDAKAYVAWLNSITSGGYRLLTEVEWEYVARAGSSRNTVFPWGNDPAEACGFANAFDRTALEHYASLDRSGYKVFDPLDCNDARLNTSSVGSYGANAFEVFDMIGNVSEWVEDCYTASHDSVSETGAPPPTGPVCAKRVAKGGSWGTLAHNLRTAERFGLASSHRDDSVGIRVAKTLKPAR